MSSLDGSDTNFNPLTLDGEPIATSSTDVIGLISANALLLDCSNVPLTGLLTVNHNPSISVNGGTYLHGTYINGGASISGDLSVVSNVYVGNNVIAFSSVDTPYLYGDFAEIGLGANTTSAIVYGKISIHNDIITDNNLSVSGITVSNKISASQYYGINEFTGNLNGHLSVSGTSHFKQTSYFNSSVIFNNPTDNVQQFGKGIYIDVADNLHFQGENVGGKVYSGQEVLVLDNSTFFAGSILRMSISELYKVNQNLSVNGNLIINGNTSTSGFLNATKINGTASVSSTFHLNTLPISGIPDYNWYDAGPNGGTTDTYTDSSIGTFTSGDYVFWISWAYKSTSTSTSGAGHKLEYWDGSSWIAVIDDNTNCREANIEYHCSRTRVVNIPSTFTQLRFRAGSLLTGTVNLIFVDLIMTRKFF